MNEKAIAWVETIEEINAEGEVALAYAGVAGLDGKVENLYKAMSLTPGVIKPANDHYLALLHNPAAPLKPWLAELIATYVAILCGSDYAALNHGENFEHYFADRSRSTVILAALRDGDHNCLNLPEDVRAAMDFTKKLSLHPQLVTQDDVVSLRDVGYDDTTVSNIAQIAASFAYWARITIALGIAAEDTIGITQVPVVKQV